MVLVFLVDLVGGPFFSFSTQAWAPARQGDKMIGGIQGLVKATDSPASTVRISAGFLGLRSLPVAVTPETEIAVNGKFGGFGDLDRGQRVRVTYEVHPDRLVAARVEVLDRSSDPPDARVPDEQTSEAMVPSLVPSVAPSTSVPPGATTSSSTRITSPAPVPQRGPAPASPPERSARPPTSASRTALRPQRATPPPVTSARPTRPPAAPGALQNAQAAVRPASRPATSPVASAAAPDPGVQAPTTPDAKHEATALAPIVSTPAPPSVSPPSSPSAPAEPALVDKIRNDWETIKREARRSGDEWRDGWRRLQRLFTD